MQLETITNKWVYVRMTLTIIIIIMIIIWYIKGSVM